MSQVLSLASQNDPLSRGKVVVTISGHRSPGSFGDVMRVLGPEVTYELVDIGQLVIRDRFMVTAVVKLFGSGPSSQDAIKDIIYRAHSAKFTVDFEITSRNTASEVTVASANSISSISSMESPIAHEEFIVTLFAPSRIPASFLASATQILAERGANIRSIDRLTDGIDPYMCIEMIVSIPSGGENVSKIRSELFELGRSQVGADVALQPSRANRMSKRIVVFDLSWTLVNGDAVDVLLEAAGVSVSETTRLAYERGEIEGPSWLRERVAVLKGSDAGVVNAKAFRALTFTDGARELCRGLKKLGCQLAVVSSGSKKIAEQAKEVLGLHYAYGNLFEVDARNKFTGVVSEPIIDAERKADLVHMLAMQEGVETEQVIAVGDGPVSSKMLAAAGMSIAFDQPGSVQSPRTGRISSKSLAGIFYLLGVSGRDFRVLGKADG